jgi:hypothetical protein
LIIENIRNPLCLNKVVNTKSIVGFSSRKKRVAQCDLGGNQIKIFQSITEASLAFSIERTQFKRHMKNGAPLKSYLFMEFDEEGRLIKPPKYIPKRRGRKRKYPIAET